MDASLYQPRLLIPGTPGIPAHMRVSDDPKVYGEFADPSVTAVVYVPKWSAPVREAFASLAARSTNSVREYQSHQNFMPDFPERGYEQMRQGRVAAIWRWLGYGLRPRDLPLHLDMVNEVAAGQLAFAAAAQQRFSSAKGSNRGLVTIMYTRKKIRHQPTVYQFQPDRLDVCQAHSDMLDVALFTNPVGTILVDQTGLKPCAANDKNPLGIQLASRLWQTPDAAFTFLRGSNSGNPQYHFIPVLPPKLPRYRLHVRP